MNKVTLLVAFLLSMSMSLRAQDKQQILITNANVFDGVNEKLLNEVDVLVEGNLIKEIGKNLKAQNAEVIDANGRTLIPGLIDAHWHTMFAYLSQAQLITSNVGFINIAAAQGAGKTLMRGFTTTREAGGNAFGVKKAIDLGMIPGPRIYPSGAPISQTSGHFDFRGPNDVPANPADPLTYQERNSMLMVADGVPEVTKRVREQLRLGASQIKLAAGGGVSSTFDPVDVSQYTYEELKAAVDVAKTWNTYVMVHVFTDAGAQSALKAGVMSIEHGNLMTDETFKMMADKGAWLSMQPIFNDEDAIPFPAGSPNQAKFVQVTDGTAKGIELAKKYGVKTAFGTDVIFDPALADKQGKLLAKLKSYYTPFEVLKMATHDNAQLIKLCGPRDPYPGDLGVIKEGALADLILVDGNPLEDIELVSDPEKNFVLIMKDGAIYKNSAKN
ncbi:amidohydrolase family protein [Robertkochia marina]|uniref:Amidohydrolase family protein n=1 Tax=Robertkochia marina TaxID=1227945 RepID=A0A4S3M3E4_9FLAO|nr:amidohydrolase family protein [Robertkochia marina]THD69616.1 amidohydrolase family protein [Robertkochia marina]TRZ40826.1 amidohydrolase family protein [Robertkochia marina]